MTRPVVASITLIVLMTVLFLLLGSKAAVQKPARIISASGTGVVHFDPDSARLFLESSTNGKTPADARNENAKRMKTVREGLLKLDLPSLKTKTVDVAIKRVHGNEPDDGSPAQVIGFSVSHSFTVVVQAATLDELNSAAGQVLDNVLENGVESTTNISFFKEDTVSLERKAMEKAVQDALANARAYANGADVTIADVTNIEGRGIGTPYSPFAGQQGQLGAFSFAGQRATSISVGKSSITCDVRITCTY